MICELPKLRFILNGSFVISLTASLGSLFFSEVLGYPPCVLCWYQRICMYPLVFIFGAAIWTEDSKFLKYSLPLSIVGLGTAIYHNLLYYGIIPDSITPCTQGISCTSKQIEFLGFVTIPVMSLVCFFTLVAFGFLASKNAEEPQYEKK